MIEFVRGLASLPKNTVTAVGIKKLPTFVHLMAQVGADNVKISLLPRELTRPNGAYDALLSAASAETMALKRGLDFFPVDTRCHDVFAYNPCFQCKRPYAIVFLYMGTSCPVYSCWYPNSFSALQILWRHIDCCQYLLSYWPTSTHEYWKANQVRLHCFGKTTNTIFSGIKLLTFGNGGWLMAGCQDKQDFFCRLCHVFF